MTQGYGPENGQQGQWGQGGQNPPQQQPWGQPEPQAPAPQPQWGQPSPAPEPQWGQASPQSAPQFGSPSASPAQPQWGQASPAAAPGGDPGAPQGAGAQYGMGTGPQFDMGDGVSWKRVKLIGLILLAGTAAVLLVRLGINLASFIGAEDMAATDTGGELGAAGVGSGLVSIVLYIVNFLLSAAMLALGIVAAVMGRGRARAGGIIVAAAIPVSIVLYWILTVLIAVILVASGGADDQTGALTATGYRITAGVTTLHALFIVVILALGSFFVHSTASKKLSA